MLRARPQRNIKGAIGIDTRFARDRHAVNRRQFGIGAQKFAEVRCDFAAPGGSGDQGTSIEVLQREAEAHIVGKIRQRLHSGAVAVQQPQRVDYKSGIAVPMKEVIRSRVVGGEHRRGHDRTSYRLDDLSKSSTSLDAIDEREAREHLGRGMAVLAINPLIERLAHQSAAGGLRWGLLKSSLRSPACTSGMLMKSFHNKPLR